MKYFICQCLPNFLTEVVSFVFIFIYQVNYLLLKFLNILLNNDQRHGSYYILLKPYEEALFSNLQ